MNAQAEAEKLALENVRQSLKAQKPTPKFFRKVKKDYKRDSHLPQLFVEYKQRLEKLVSDAMNYLKSNRNDPFVTIDMTAPYTIDGKTFAATTAQYGPASTNRVPISAPFFDKFTNRDKSVFSAFTENGVHPFRDVQAQCLEQGYFLVDLSTGQDALLDIRVFSEPPFETKPFKTWHKLNIIPGLVTYCLQNNLQVPENILNGKKRKASVSNLESNPSSVEVFK